MSANSNKTSAATNIFIIDKYKDCFHHELFSLQTKVKPSDCKTQRIIYYKKKATSLYI